MKTYRVNEIFVSIQGEGWNTGGGCDTTYMPGIARETMQNQFNGVLPRYSYQPITEEDGTIDPQSLLTAIEKVRRDTQCGIMCRLSVQLHQLINIR